MNKLFIFAFMVTVSSMSFGQTTPNKGTGQDCGEIANKIRPEADKCIGIKNHAKRTKCSEKLKF